MTARGHYTGNYTACFGAPTTRPLHGLHETRETPCQQLHAPLHELHAPTTTRIRGFLRNPGARGEPRNSPEERFSKMTEAPQPPLSSPATPTALGLHSGRRHRTGR